MGVAKLDCQLLFSQEGSQRKCTGLERRAEIKSKNKTNSVSFITDSSSTP